jgi:hypothetical protein
MASCSISIIILGALEFASPELLYENVAFVRVAVKKKGEALKNVSPELQDDRETVILAIKQNGHALEVIYAHTYICAPHT